MVDTRVVTGYPLDPATATPEGCFYVWQKQSPAGVDDGDIMGDVDYLLLFHDNLGVHDSSWRQDYGRDMNYFDGTPGCVNAPYDAVRSIYGMADEGTPVIIYL